MRFGKTILASVSILALCPVAASAQALSAEDAAKIRSEMAEMKAKLEAMESLLSSVSQQQQQTKTVVAENTAAVAQTAAAVKKQPDVKVTWKGGPKIEGKGGWSFKPRGRLQVDFATVGAPSSINDPGLGFSNELRRARLAVVGTVPGGFGYKFEADFAGNNVSVADAIISFKNGGTKVEIGNQNNFQSLEELTSSLNISFMERSALTDAFGFERRVGVSVTHRTGDVELSGGVFTANINNLNSDETNSYSLDGRAVWTPKFGNTQVHLGGSVHWRDLNALGRGTKRYRQRPFVHSTDTRFLNTGNFQVTEELNYGLEGAVINGPLHATGEVHWLQAKRPGLANPTFFGGYAEVGYFFTKGDTRGYKGSKFDRIKPKNPLGGGGIGAIQANLRYDHLDLNDAGIVGGTQNTFAASLIWTPVTYVRFLLNYAHINYRNAAIAAGTSRNYSADVAGVRAQIDF